MGRPSKPIISKELAARAALEIIDAEGVEGLNLERVARKIGVKAPSLYYHFHNKAELLAKVTKLILREGETDTSKPGPDWRENLVNLSIATRRSILRHPRAATLLLQFFPRHVMLPAYEEWIQIYDLPPEWQMVVIEGVEKLTFGSALFSANCIAQGIESMPPFEPDQYPHLDTAIRANHLSEEEMFIETLRRFLSAF